MLSTTLPEANSSHLKIGRAFPTRKGCIFQALIFRGEKSPLVSVFRGQRNLRWREGEGNVVLDPGKLRRWLYPTSFARKSKFLRRTSPQNTLINQENWRPWHLISDGVRMVTIISITSHDMAQNGAFQQSHRIHSQIPKSHLEGMWHVMLISIENPNTINIYQTQSPAMSLVSIVE